MVSETYKQIEAARLHGTGLRIVQSGFTDLDRITSGWQRSDLIIVAARPGMGKTAFVLSLCKGRPFHLIDLDGFSRKCRLCNWCKRMISSETGNCIR